MRLRPRESALRCAYCHDDEPPLVACPGCGSRAHRDCGAEGCATMGCSRARPRNRPLATAPPPLPAAPPFPDWVRPAPTEPPVQGRPFFDRPGRGMDAHDEAF